MQPESASSIPTPADGVGRTHGANPTADGPRDRSNWRAGQRAFNELSETHPTIAARILGTEDDPYYDDRRLGRFAERVRALLEHDERPDDDGSTDR